MYTWFETKNAYYFIFNNKHMMHLKEWDNNPSLKYHYVEISESEYRTAYLAYKE